MMTQRTRATVSGNALLPLAEQRAEERKHVRAEKQTPCGCGWCNTRKQLVEALPEFEKYAPQETEPNWRGCLLSLVWWLIWSRWLAEGRGKGCASRSTSLGRL